MTLDELAIRHGTDKSSLHHNYCHIYEQYFKHLQHEPILFVTVGVGGYEYPDRGGQCLRMWREWFTKARIIGIDLYKKDFAIPGVEIMQCSQDNPYMADICRGANIFIDDGAHTSLLTLRTFNIVWPVLSSAGIYVIEDVECSYGNYGNWADAAPLHDYKYPTPVNMCRGFIDVVNAQYSGALDIGIESIHFHKNVILIKKR